MGPKKLTAIGVIALFFAIGAVADDGHNNGGHGDNGNGAFESGLVGSVPNTTVAGVPSGGVPWVVNRGEAAISSDGRLHVEISGLLITSGTGVNPALVGTTGPVAMVGASVVCGGSGGSVVASSDGTILTPTGFAEIETTVTLPDSCMAPAVLVRIFDAAAPAGSQLGRFIALSGFSAGPAGNNNNQNNNNGNDNNNNGNHGNHDR